MRRIPRPVLRTCRLPRRSAGWAVRRPGGPGRRTGGPVWRTGGQGRWAGGLVRWACVADWRPGEIGWRAVVAD